MNECNPPPEKVPRPASSAPFDFGLYGIIVVCLAFLVAMTYFLAIVTFADEIVWNIEVLVCGTCGMPFVGPEVMANRDFAFTANFLGWPILLALAFAIERVISTRNERSA